MAAQFQLSRNPHGKLLLTLEGATYEVVPVRNFPISSPTEHLSLVDSGGKERLVIASMADLSDDLQRLLTEELDQREFTPVISQISTVDTFTTPSTWQVLTDRGPTELVLKGEEDIRRIGLGALVITDAHGIQYSIKNVAGLDRRSQRFLERFL